MELKDLFTLYRRWIWLLILGLVVGLASGYAASRIQERVYEASAKVLVTRTRQPGGTDILSISDQQLVQTYLQLLKTRSVQEEVGSRLGVEVDGENIKVDVIPDTQILQIKVQDAEPARAAAITSEMVQVLVEENETLQGGRYTAYEQGLNQQIVQVQEQISALQSQISEIDQANIDEQLDLVDRQITDMQAEISTLEAEIAAFPSVLSTLDRARLNEKQSRLDQLRPLLSLYQQIRTNLVFVGRPTLGTGMTDPQVTSLQATLNLYQQLYLNLLNNLETIKLARAQSIPTLTTIEEADVPKNPIRPIPLLYITLAGIVGLIIAAGAVLLKDYFDDTVQSSQTVREVLGLPVLAEIAQTDKPDPILTPHATGTTGSAFANSFGILRINVHRLIAQNPKKSILITSGALGEGKTTIAINLAASFVQAGKRVALLDADFYQPSLHTRLGLQNKRGLTDVLAEDLDWREVAQDAAGMIVITSGYHPEASVAQLESDAMTKLLQQLQEDSDVILLDAPPLLIVDSQVLSTAVGGVLLVVRRANTSTAAVRTMLEQLKLMGVNVLGVVLNRVPREDSYYYGRSGYFGKNGRKESKGEGEELETHQS